MSRVLGPAVAAAIPLSAVQAPAHHSFVGHYDATRLVTLKGTVTKTRYGSPHIFLPVDVQSGFFTDLQSIIVPGRNTVKNRSTAR